MNIESKVKEMRLIKWREIDWLQNDNFKQLDEAQFIRLKNSLVTNNFIQPFFIYEKSKKVKILDGKHRKQAMLDLEANGWINPQGETVPITIPDELPALVMDFKSEQEAAKGVLAFSSKYAYETDEGLYEFMHKFGLKLPELKDFADLPNVDWRDFEKNFFDTTPPDKKEPGQNGQLTARYIIPPFSVFDTRQGYWQARKKLWIDRGIESELGRDNVQQSLASAFTLKQKAGSNQKLNTEDIAVPTWAITSIFDPVLCEILYEWFCPESGAILDPFAGGSVRGVIASYVGRSYTGIDLSERQIAANELNFEKLQGHEPDVLKNKPEWIVGNSAQLDKHVKGREFDFIMSCPPYHDLEVYSTNPDDLSNMSYEQFEKQYRQILSKSAKFLKNDRFACFVIGNIRDKNGFYKNLVQLTISAFEAEGALLYNDIVLVNVAGTLPVRAGAMFTASRKVGKMHQNVLVFYKGDPRNIKSNFPAIDLSAITVDTENDNGGDK